eukprot:CAMPEP_0172732928 /NCGR_PEP_ID=MMETSP1074-20121228/105727_1 /TAXON_ID=2916 /ORGANISM="Ceratium fusus, Strain PA161109" /LENGTH=141 /DNA_ID=CAMNT_0013561333 /DNA_START=23 /DNA_END=444 /DNA_ORIENTATION=+
MTCYIKSAAVPYHSGIMGGACRNAVADMLYLVAEHHLTGVTLDTKDGKPGTIPFEAQLTWTNGTINGADANLCVEYGTSFSQHSDGVQLNPVAPPELPQLQPALLQPVQPQPALRAQAEELQKTARSATSAVSLLAKTDPS